MTNISYIEQSKINLFEHFWSNSDDNMFLASLDEDGDFVAVDMNPSQISNLGQSEEILNKKLKEILGEETAYSIEEKYLKCLKENKTLIEEETIEINGEKRHFNTMIIPIHDKEKDKKSIIGISREITELKTAKENLDELNRQLNLLTNENDIATEYTYDKIKTLAFEDSLTGIGNRRYLNDHANKAISLAHRYNSCLTLMVLDIDGLAYINDTFCHTFGDKILQEFANLLKKSIRDSDILARYGGEEFLLLLPMTAINDSTVLAKRLLEETRNLNFKYHDKKTNITTSIGIAELESPHDNLDSLLHKTYDALKVAKQEGKNRVVSFIDKNVYKTDI